MPPPNGSKAGWIAEHHSCHHMVSRIHVADAAGDVASEIADEAGSHRADIFETNKPSLRRSRTSVIDELVEMIDARPGASLERTR